MIENFHWQSQVTDLRFDDEFSKKFKNEKLSSSAKKITTENTELNFDDVTKEPIAVQPKGRWAQRFDSQGIDVKTSSGEIIFFPYTGLQWNESENNENIPALQRIDSNPVKNLEKVEQKENSINFENLKTFFESRVSLTSRYLSSKGVKSRKEFPPKLGKMKQMEESKQKLNIVDARVTLTGNKSASDLTCVMSEECISKNATATTFANSMPNLSGSDIVSNQEDDISSSSYSLSSPDQHPCQTGTTPVKKNESHYRKNSTSNVKGSNVIKKALLSNTKSDPIGTTSLFDFPVRRNSAHSIITATNPSKVSRSSSMTTLIDVDENSGFLRPTISWKNKMKSNQRNETQLPKSASSWSLTTSSLGDESDKTTELQSLRTRSISSIFFSKK